MKKIKPLFAAVALMAVVAAPLTLTTGCVTGPDGQPDEQTIQDAAVILRGTARSAAAIAIDENPENTKYVQLAVTVLDQFLVGDEYTPGALVDALEPITAKVSDVKIKVALNTMTDLYEIFYGRYVRGQFKGKSTAFLMVKYMRDGAAQALPAQ